VNQCEQRLNQARIKHGFEYARLRNQTHWFSLLMDAFGGIASFLGPRLQTDYE
jgi:hypothetical protein